MSLGRIGAITAVTTTLLFATPRASDAQTCLGTPPRGGISADYGKVSFGTAYGGTATYAGSHTAISLSAHAADYGSTLSGVGGDGRFALIIGAGRVAICPNIGIGLDHRTWKPSTVTLTSNQLTGTAGVSVGWEQPIVGQFSVIPFAGVRYAFSVVKYDVTGTDIDTQTTGDTLSGPEAHYGVVARYNIVYAGFVGDRTFTSSNPSSARWLVGVTFPIGIRKP